MILKYTIIWTILSLSKPANSVFVIDILKMSQIITEGLYKFWEFLEPRFEVPDAPAFFNDKDEKMLMSKVSEINNKLIDIEEKISYIQDTTRNLISKQSERILMHLQIKPLLEDVDFINRMFKMYIRYMKNGFDHTLRSTLTGQYNIERHTLEDFALTITSHDERSVLMRMEKINEYIEGSETRSFVNMKGIFIQINEYSKILGHSNWSAKT